MTPEGNFEIYDSAKKKKYFFDRREFCTVEPLIHDEFFPQCYSEKNGFYVQGIRVQEHCLLHNIPVNVIVLSGIFLDRLVHKLVVKAEPPHFVVSFTPIGGDTKYYCNQTEKITIPYIDDDEIKCPSISRHTLLNNKAEEMLAYKLWTFLAGFACLIILNLY